MAAPIWARAEFALGSGTRKSSWQCGQRSIAAVLSSLSIVNSTAVPHLRQRSRISRNSLSRIFSSRSLVTTPSRERDGFSEQHSNSA